MLKLSGIWKSFPRDGLPLPVLAGIDLEVERRGFAAVLGPSGCGKSTLLNIVSGTVTPDSGSILIDGRAVQSGRGRVAYMQQNDLLLPWRTAVENAILGPELRRADRREARKGAEGLFHRFGLGSFEGCYPAELSGGMRQRVALIRTLLTQKEILLLDEPFGSLDAMTRRVLHRYLLQVFEEFGKTIVFVTHDLEEALLLADRVYLLTSRPARVKSILNVPLAQPRERTDPEFVGLERDLEHLVQEELHEAFS